ncbi:MAG: DUF86 domain-containing protein [Armatimonadetes bacterium]|nr:DUF86 domain-containing protein [Armatimonadota bacterium]
MVDTSLLLRRLATIRHSLDRLKSKRELSRAEFLADPDAQDVVLRHLQVGVQAALDAAFHVIRDAGWELPGASVASFEVLARHGVLEPELADRLRLAGQMRNLLVHVYDAINLDRVYEAYQHSAEDLERFCQALVVHFHQ